MNKALKIILILAIGVLVVLCNWYSISARLWPVRSADWEGTWVLDKETDVGHFHGRLSISTVAKDSAVYDFSYTNGEESYHETLDPSLSAIKVFHSKIIHIVYFTNGKKNVVTTYTLSHDRQRITKTTDTCPGFFEGSEVAPDGCEIPVDDGVYYRAQ